MWRISVQAPAQVRCKRLKTDRWTHAVGFVESAGLTRFGLFGPLCDSVHAQPPGRRHCGEGKHLLPRGCRINVDYSAGLSIPPQETHLTDLPSQTRTEALAFRAVLQQLPGPFSPSVSKADCSTNECGLLGRTKAGAVLAF